MGLYSHTALCVRRFYEQRSSGSILQFLTRWRAFFDIALQLSNGDILTLCERRLEWAHADVLPAT